MAAEPLPTTIDEVLDTVDAPLTDIEVMFFLGELGSEEAAAELGMSTADDDLLAATYERVERFRIETLGHAAWAGRKLANAQSDVAEISTMVADQINALRAYQERATRAGRSSVAFFEDLLVSYAHRRRASDGVKTVTVPTAKVSSRPLKVTFEVDEDHVDEFLEWAAENCPGAVKRSPLISGVPDVAIVDDPDTYEPVVLSGGQRVPGVNVKLPELGPKEKGGGGVRSIEHVIEAAGDPDSRETVETEYISYSVKATGPKAARGPAPALVLVDDLDADEG